MKFQDRVVNEVREKCIRKAYPPRNITKKYETRIENGKLIIGELK